MTRLSIRGNLLYLSLYLSLFLCLTGVTSHSNAQINITHTCLRLIEQSAADLKRCLVKQRAEAECDSATHQLETQLTDCRQQQFTQDDIQYALRQGESAVAGDKNYSPYAKKVLKNRQDSRATQGNRDNFSRQFPTFTQQHPQTLQHTQRLNFDVKGCENQYFAAENRVVYSGKQTAKRYDLSPAHNPAKTPPSDAPQAMTNTNTIHYFSAMASGKCYQPPKANERLVSGEFKIVNIPTIILTELSPTMPHTRTVFCESEKICSAKKQDLVNWKLKYQKAYLTYQRILHCIEKENDNTFLRRIHRKGFSKLPLPDYCPAGNMKEKLDNQRLLVKEIEFAIFGPTASNNEKG